MNILWRSSVSTFLALLFLLSCSVPKEKASTQVDFCSLIHSNDSLSLTGELSTVSEQMQKKTGVYVLEDGGTSLIARAWLSEHAEKTIDVQYFIFSTDNVGLIACDYLVRAADRGVKVRILVDDIMVEAEAEEILTLDSHENISIKIYNPGANVGKNIYDKVKKLSTDFHGFNQRMHNKIFVVDSKVAITGGRNMADEYFDYDHEYNFRDRDVLLLGKEVTNMQNSFNGFWNDKRSVAVSSLLEDEEIVDSTKSDRFSKLHQYACNPENFWPQVRERIKKLPDAFKAIQQTGELVWLDSVRFISDKPGKNERENLSGGGITTDSLMHLIRRAKHTIEIQSPYLITTEVGQKLFKEAVARGVKIRILTNSLSSTDNLEAFNGYQRDRNKLLQAGVRIFEFKPDAKERFTIMTGELQQKMNFTPIFGLHAKSMVLDGEVTVIGTFNLDPRSANLNTECFALIYSKQIAASVLKGMEEEFKSENSWETTLQYNPDKEAGLKKRLKTYTKRVVPKKIL
jgi:phosphatidylserine/phosphatidylglycerophosphate/cardiolipin synthase-like enzyme